MAAQRTQDAEATAALCCFGGCRWVVWAGVLLALILSTASSVRGQETQAAAQVSQVERLVQQKLRPARTAGQWEEAIQAGKDALAICQQIQDQSVRKSTLAFCYREIGQTWFESGENGRAEDCYRQALSSCGGPPFEGSIAASVLNSRATLAMSEGGLGQALADFEAALKALEKSQAPNVGAQRAAVYANIGSIYRAQENFDQALDYYRRAAEADPGTPQQKAIRLNNTGSILLAQHKTDEARAKFQAALDLDVQAQRPPTQLATRYNNLALTYLAQDPPDLSQAEQLLSKACVGLTEASRVYPVTLTNVGGVYLQRGRIEEAQACFQRAAGIALSRRAWQWAGTALKLLGDSYAERFRSSHDPGQLLPAVACYSQAAEIVEQLRGQVAGGDEDRALFWEAHADVYTALLRTLLDLAKHPDRFLPSLAAGKGDTWDALALHWAERSRNKNLLEMLKGRELGRGKTEGREVRELALERLRTWQALHEGATGRECTAREQRALEAYEQAVLAVRAAGQEEFLSLTTVLPPEVKDIQSRLDPNEALVEYHLADQDSMVFVVRRGSVKALPLPADREAVTDAVEAWRAAIMIAAASPARLGLGKWQSYGNSLYNWLLGPVQPMLPGVTRLTIVPHGILHHLPFEALVVQPDSEVQRGRVATPKLLCDEGFVIRYAPSASVLKYAESKNPHRLQSALVVGNAICPAGWKPLPMAEVEAATVAKLFGAKAYVKREATERLAKTLGASRDLLHFATHGKLDSEFPLASRVLLTADEAEDGELTVGEVFNEDLRAYLVTLSACETGKVSASMPGKEVLTGDDLVGLSRAFLYAGTPSVVCSLWQVSDQSTGWLMARFCEELSGSQQRDKASALQKARDAVRHRQDKFAGSPVENPYAHPFFWAPFVLIGDWR